MELAGIMTGLLLAVGGLVVLLGLVLHVLLARHPGIPGGLARLAAWLAWRLGRLTGHGRWDPTAVTGPAVSALIIELILGLAAVALAAVGAGVLVEDVTHGDGLAVLDHPVASFVAAHRTAALTSAMKAISAAGGPVGMTLLALGAGLLLRLAWRSFTPTVVLAVTAAGVIALTAVFKAALGRARPPLGQAVAAADGYGFPSGHAAAAAAVLGAAAWLCSLTMRSWLGRVATWAAAAMLAALVGMSRVYLGVHWTSDVVGGWAFGVLWMALVVSAWTAFWRIAKTRG